MLTISFILCLVIFILENIHVTLREKCPNTDQKKIGTWTIFTRYLDNFHFLVLVSAGIYYLLLKLL